MKMKNDLTPFERDLVKKINWMHGTNFKANQLMEWSTSKKIVEGNLREDEKMYSLTDYHVAFRVDTK